MKKKVKLINLNYVINKPKHINLNYCIAKYTTIRSKGKVGERYICKI